ncbi:DivIVA domain-containing protein [Candidatus Solirubrobacter pratensis]|uniref:DivIVA domain-containing protein n=1 Tax=Candidatus Solirubrobacter pratensis TaxID=1298857 RepID=UPI00041ABEDD|nr:DivIVA domain-containing protein [Candidatus Solirubrobacter pratensis]
MDRDSIQRRDFPTGRKGYDPAAVDEHLRRVADEFERSVAPAAARPLSSGTSEQVRVILEAAERSAAELRAKAGEEAGDHVARVRGAADGLLGRLDELERELGGLLDALRTSGERLSAGLAELQERVADQGDSAPPPGPAEPSVLDAPLVDSGADEAGARLIALNMALGGTPREETARYLAEHFALGDLEALLDDVYTRAGQ